MTTYLETIARFFKITKLVIIQTIQRNILSVKRSWFLSPTTQPNLLQVLAQKHYLYSARIFKPQKSQEGCLRPLVILCHGGGFIMNNPSLDDPFAKYLSDRCDCWVVSIDYRKAPGHRFPDAYEDVVQQVVELIGSSNSNLYIDTTRVILSGFSAGGNLVLAAAQDSRLRGRIHGVIGLYPVVNMVPSAAEQLARRPDPTIPDFLGNQWDDVLDLYVGSIDAVILKDPRLSPALYESRQHLPLNIFLSGCEHDMLCHEAMKMAERLQGETSSGSGQVQWKLIRGQTHAFDLFPARTEGLEEARLEAKDELWSEVAQFISDTCARSISE